MHKRFRCALARAAVLALLCASLTTFSSTAIAQQGTFVPTGSMNTGRQEPSATLLSNGMVLIAGGISTTNGRLASAELYNPTTGTFTPTGSMSDTRWGHTATLLNNGMVLIVGGQGTAGNVAFLGTAELYDPTTGTFTSTGSLNTGRHSHTATLLNSGTVLVAGCFGT